jgi:hypothetical protein
MIRRVQYVRKMKGVGGWTKRRSGVWRRREKAGTLLRWLSSGKSGPRGSAKFPADPCRSLARMRLVYTSNCMTRRLMQFYCIREYENLEDEGGENTKREIEIRK